MTLSFTNNQLTEINGREIVIGAGYRIKNLTFNVVSLEGGGNKTIKNDLVLKLDLGFKRDKTILRRIDENNNQVSAGQSKINWNNLTDQVKKDNNIKELGKETIAGKECTKYSMTMDMMGNSMEQTIWIYKGITLKTSMQSEMGEFGQSCKKFEEKAVEASMFALPANYKVEEFQMPDFGGFGGF